MGTRTSPPPDERRFLDAVAAALSAVSKLPQSLLLRSLAIPLFDNASASIFWNGNISKAEELIKCAVGSALRAAHGTHEEVLAALNKASLQGSFLLPVGELDPMTANVGDFPTNQRVQVASLEAFHSATHGISPQFLQNNSPLQTLDQQVGFAIESYKNGKPFSKAIVAVLYAYVYSLDPQKHDDLLAQTVAGFYIGSAAQLASETPDAAVLTRCEGKNRALERGVPSESHTEHIQLLNRLVSEGKLNREHVHVRVVELHLCQSDGLQTLGGVDGLIRFLEAGAIRECWNYKGLLNKSGSAFSPRNAFNRVSGAIAGTSYPFSKSIVPL
jgi:hypothetical protein